MAPVRAPFVYEATLRLAAHADPAAVGAAVTTELCGAVEHEGPCRWPHNNAIEADDDVAAFRTLFVAEPSEAGDVQRRIGIALRKSSHWTVASERARAVRKDEEELAARLGSTPARTS